MKKVEGNGIQKVESSRLGNYEIHKSDHSCNPEVLDLIARAKLTNTRECINSLAEKRESQEIRQTKENGRVNERAKVLKSEIGGEER